MKTPALLKADKSTKQAVAIPGVTIKELEGGGILIEVSPTVRSEALKRATESLYRMYLQETADSGGT